MESGQGVRDRIEAALGRWGHRVYRHGWITIALVLCVVAALLTQLPKVRIDTSTESFLHEDDPIRITYEAFRDQFGRDDLIMVGIETEEVFDLDFLERLRAFHAAVEEEVPRLVEVNSLVNARNTHGRDEELIVGELLEDWPEGPEALAEIRGRALANPLYRDLLISEDARFATVTIETDVYSGNTGDTEVLEGFGEANAPAPSGGPRYITDEENSQIVTALAAVIERHRAPGFEIFPAGMPVMMHALHTAMQRDMVRFTGLSLLTIAALLFALFRRAGGVALPLVIVACTILSTLSFMGLFDLPLTVPTQILPSFLVAVGVGGAVHLMVIFFQRYDTGESKEDAIAGALSHSGLAVTMTSLTTAGGLASFLTADIAPLSDFGIFAPMGVLISLVMTLVLLPALIAVSPLRRRPGSGAEAGKTAHEERWTQRFLVHSGAFATRHAGTVAAVGLGLVVLAAVGASQLRFSHDPVTWFPSDHPFRIALDKVEEKLRGSLFLEVVIDTGEENGLMDPDTLRRIAVLRDQSAQVRVDELYVGKTVSIVDVSEEIHQALNENRPEFRTIPGSRELISQELLLFENSGTDDLEKLVDSRFSRARFTMKMPWGDAVTYGPFLAELDAVIPAALGDRADYEMTGMMAMLGRTLGAVMISMAKTYVAALAIITPLMILLIGRFRIGLLSMVPNLTPILLTLGIMGASGVALDGFTLLIGSIAIGLAVDDTIHFLHNFRRYYEAGQSVEEAVRSTLRTTGQALLFTTLVLSLGFFVYALSSLQNLVNFGVLTGITLVFAFVADLILAPALLTLTLGREEREPSP